MSLNRFHRNVVAGWFLTLAVLASIGLALGHQPTVGDAIGGILLWSVPAIIFVLIFRGAPPNTIAQVLYDAEQAPALGSVGIAPPRDRSQGLR